MKKNRNAKQIIAKNVDRKKYQQKNRPTYMQTEMQIRCKK